MSTDPLSDEELIDIRAHHRRWLSGGVSHAPSVQFDMPRLFATIADRDAEIERLRETLKRLQSHLSCDDETILIGLDEARQDIAAALNP